MVAASAAAGAPLGNRDAAITIAVRMCLKLRFSGAPIRRIRREAPKGVPAIEGVRVAAEARAGRQALQQTGVAATEHEVVAEDRVAKELDNHQHVLPPALLTEAFEAAQA